MEGTIKLYEGVEKPASRRGRGAKGSKYPFAAMKVGMAFKLVFTSDKTEDQEKECRKLRTAALGYQKRNARIKFETWTVTPEQGAKEEEKGAGIWVMRMPDLTDEGLKAREEFGAKIRASRAKTTEATA